MKTNSNRKDGNLGRCFRHEEGAFVTLRDSPDSTFHIRNRKSFQMADDVYHGGRYCVRNDENILNTRVEIMKAHVGHLKVMHIGKFGML